jgi:ribosome recycling factor
MLNELYEETKQKMKKSEVALKDEYKTLRTGKASLSALDSIKVNYYDNATPLNQVASVTLLDATTIQISPWEKTILGDIEKAILESSIGVNPNTDDDGIKLCFPPMTSEQREETAKTAKTMTDNTKVSIRNIRKDSNNRVKSLLKDKEITEDENRQALAHIQKLTDDFITGLDSIFKIKEAEILKI